MGTVLGVNTRRYHGLLVAATKPPVGRIVALHSMIEQLVIPKNEVAKVLNSEISMMPEGLLGALTDQEVRDLIYYLGRPGQVPLPEEVKK